MHVNELPPGSNGNYRGGRRRCLFTAIRCRHLLWGKEPPAGPASAYQEQLLLQKQQQADGNESKQPQLPPMPQVYRNTCQFTGIRNAALKAVKSNISSCSDAAAGMSDSKYMVRYVRSDGSQARSRGKASMDCSHALGTVKKGELMQQVWGLAQQQDFNLPPPLRLLAVNHSAKRSDFSKSVADAINVALFSAGDTLRQLEQLVGEMVGAWTERLTPLLQDIVSARPNYNTMSALCNQMGWANVELPDGVSKSKSLKKWQAYLKHSHSNNPESAVQLITDDWSSQALSALQKAKSRAAHVQSCVVSADAAVPAAAAAPSEDGCTAPAAAAAAKHRKPRKWRAATEAAAAAAAAAATATTSVAQTAGRTTAASGQHSQQLMAGYEQQGLDALDLSEAEQLELALNLSAQEAQQCSGPAAMGAAAAASGLSGYGVSADAAVPAAAAAPSEDGCTAAAAAKHRKPRKRRAATEAAAAAAATATTSVAQAAGKTTAASGQHSQQLMAGYEQQGLDLPKAEQLELALKLSAQEAQQQSGGPAAMAAAAAAAAAAASGLSGDGQQGRNKRRRCQQQQSQQQQQQCQPSDVEVMDLTQGD